MPRKWILAGVLLLVELALCGLIVYVSWGGLGAIHMGEGGFRFVEMDTVSAQSDEEQRLPVTGPVTLDVDDPHGDITIAPGATDEVVVTAHKTAWGANQAEAEAHLAALRVVVTQAGNAVTVRVERPEDVTLVGVQRSDVVHFVIAVPPETAVTANTSFGAITLSGVRRDADLETSNGAISVTDVSGDLTLDSSFGAISVENAQAGRVTAHTSNGAVELRDVQAEADVSMSSNFGNLSFAAGSARSLDLDTDNGTIVLDDLDVDGPAVLRSSFGDFTLTHVAAASYDLHSDNGDITVDGAAGPLQISSEFGSIGITHGQNARLDLRSGNGQVEYSGSLSSGPHTVSSNFGNIMLALPADTALTVDLQTGFGHVQTALPITVSGDADTAHLRGTLNGGGPDLKASSDNGDVTLNVLES